MKFNKFIISTALIFSSSFSYAGGEEIDSVDTAFKLLGANHKIVVEVFDDPKVNGVSCYVSRAKTGGIKGSIGIAEDKSESSIACRQVGEISFKGSIEKKEEVFSQSTSLLFKTLKVYRIVDNKRKVLTYLTVSDKIIDGSPQNSITAVPVGKVIPLKQN